MDAFRKDFEAFKNRHILLLKSAENRKLIQTLLEASGMLIASAANWRREVQSEGEAAEFQRLLESAKKQDETERSGKIGATLVQHERNLRAALETRDKAATERATQWETFQRLVDQASALAPPR